MMTILILTVQLFFLNSSVFLGDDENRVDEKPGQIVLVSEDEPGEPMIVSGTVYAPDGETPVPGIKVHVYQTDAEGYYARPGDDVKHRIKGDMVTNAEGRYQFKSIMPASYPDTTVPSHVHYVVSGEEYRQQRFTLHFKDDPHTTAEQYERAAKKGKFKSIIPLEKDDDGILHGKYNLKLSK